MAIKANEGLSDTPDDCRDQVGIDVLCQSPRACGWSVGFISGSALAPALFQELVAIPEEVSLGSRLSLRSIGEVDFVVRDSVVEFLKFPRLPLSKSRPFAVRSARVLKTWPS